MSSPIGINSDDAPDHVREFRDKLQAFNLAVGEWLGLNPEQVFRFDLTEGEEPQFDPRALHGMVGGEYTRVTWESTEKQAPRIGHVTHGWRIDAGTDLMDFVFTAELLIDWMDDRERLDTIGPKPRMFSAVEEARLKAMFPGPTNVMSTSERSVVIVGDVMEEFRVVHMDTEHGFDRTSSTYPERSIAESIQAERGGLIESREVSAWRAASAEVGR